MGGLRFDYTIQMDDAYGEPKKREEGQGMNELLEKMNQELVGTGDWEFASAEWCQPCGELGARLLQESDLDLSKYKWGFSEEYTLTPERLMAGREAAGYYFMMSDGEVSGGTGLPEECLALPGFHIKANWAAIEC